MKMIIIFLIFLLAIIFLDIVGYKGFKRFLESRGRNKYNKNVLRIYWLLDVLFVIFSIFWIYMIRSSDWPDHVQYRNYFYISGAFFLIYIPKIIFSVFIILNFLKNILVRLFRSRDNASGSSGRPGKNMKNQFIPAAGIIVASLVFVWIVYGIAIGKHNFKVEEVELYFDELPQSFDGYTIAHFSDTHLGSFANDKAVKQGLNIIDGLNADIVIFSGDLVNNEATEVVPYVDEFAEIDTGYGKFSVLGNHDMGDYRRWYTIEEKNSNMRDLEDMFEKMDFQLLRNEHTFITNGRDSVLLAGVDNWGKPPFAQYGDLNEALGNQSDFPFIILISHDPTHWRAEVIPETDIQLTLAGHTHGMQMGLLTPWFSWSPSPYDEWYGVYREGEQVLYVNRGFGFLGLPARIGMPPEITLITLRSKS